MNKFRLKVQKIEQICLFELTWGQGQQMVATLPCPALLPELYQDWRRIYLSFYKTVELPLFPATRSTSESSWRGWSIAGGQLTPDTVDWHTKLVEAETRLLNEFHRWLRSAELFEIRAAIARASREAAIAALPHPSITVFLTCTPIEMARYPWEGWEIGADFAGTGTIHIIRTPATVRAETVPPTSQRRKTRILAIMGDDSGLNFQADRDAVQSLSRIATITFVGWQPGQTATQVKEQICEAIANTQGWDVLFFAGHSNETEITGGELAIAPGVSIAIRDITSQLMAAKERGLQVAIFNSCSGLSIAESLISLGFSQVAVMREPIHNRVAQEFLVQFLRGLAAHQNVHEALIAASRFLRFEKNLTYPSAYLVPSLFCHPGASLFQIEPFRWQHYFQQMLPTPWEAVVLTLGIALSLIPTIQAGLLDTRMWVQSVYRQSTAQMPPTVASPPIALIQIDTASISENGISQLHPIDRYYLAKLIDQIAAQNAQIIGVDFVLDTLQPGDTALGTAIQNAVAQSNVWFVFGAVLDPSGEIGMSQTSPIATRTWSIQGYIDADPLYVMLPYPGQDCRQVCPFAYLLALVHTAHPNLNSGEVQPAAALKHEISLSSSSGNTSERLDLRSHLLTSIDSNTVQDPSLFALRQLHLHPISVWAYEYWGQHWLEPLIDFSIPSDRVYQRISAWQLLDPQQAQTYDFSQRIVILAPGADERTGIAPGEPDRFPAPMALRYRQPQQYWLTGGESLAYMVHHQLTSRLVIPIPDLWLVGIATLLGKGIALWLNNPNRQPWTRSQRLRFAAIGGMAIALYGLIGLQLYISAAILLPWMLPSAIVWLYLLPALRRHHA
jgi:hypothetical protein